MVCNGQQQFVYQFYIDDTVREGILFFNEKENNALYLDKISQTKRISNQRQAEKDDASVAFVGGNMDGIFYKNDSKIVFTQDLLKTSFIVEDELPEIKWELLPEKKEIQNLVCYKAVTNFRGRKWQAWYCPEIPISYGPWKFYGLPGLIVEIKDNTHRFAFNLSNYNLKTNNPEPKIDTSTFKKVSMKQMADNVNEAFESINRIMSASENEEVIVINNSENKGIELKYEWEE